MFKKLREFAWVVVLALGLTFTIGGTKGAMDAIDAKDRSVKGISSLNLTTPPSASVPNAKVDDSETATAMIESVALQTATATGGKSYVELPAGDPRKEAAMAAADLQNALSAFVIGYEVAELSKVLGITVVLAGLVMLLVGTPIAYSSLRRVQFSAEPLHR